MEEDLNIFIGFSQKNNIMDERNGIWKPRCNIIYEHAGIIPNEVTLVPDSKDLRSSHINNRIRNKINKSFLASIDKTTREEEEKEEKERLKNPHPIQNGPKQTGCIGCMTPGSPTAPHKEECCLT